MIFQLQPNERTQLSLTKLLQKLFPTPIYRRFVTLTFKLSDSSVSLSVCECVL